MSRIKNFLYSVSLIIGLCPFIIEASSLQTNDKNHTSFKGIFLAHELNASDKWENYLEIYQSHFKKFIGKSPNILEIGVQNGGSLQIMDKYFINGKVYGIDIEPKVCELALGTNIKTFCFDASDKEAVGKNLTNLQFDIIIDDGSHLSQDVIKTFRNLFSKVKPGGVYLIEDLHASYWETHQGGYLKQDSSIEFLKGMIDLLNLPHIRDEKYAKAILPEDKYLAEWVESISFYDSVAVIKKTTSIKKENYKRITVGKFQPVFPIIDHAKKDGYYYNRD